MIISDIRIDHEEELRETVLTGSQIIDEDYSSDIDSDDDESDLEDFDIAPLDILSEDEEGYEEEEEQERTIRTSRSGRILTSSRDSAYAY